MWNAEEFASKGFIVRKFCGIPVGQIDEAHFIACDKEAIGELTFVVEERDGPVPIAVPVCQGCLDKFREKEDIEELDNGNATLLD